MQTSKTKPQTHHRSPNHAEGRRRMRWASLCATLCVALTLSACASLGGGGNPQQQVRQRATERWQALVKGEISRAYSYNTPGFRAVVTPDGYRNRIGSSVIWLGAEVNRVECLEADKCTAVVRIDYKPVMMRQNSDKFSTHVDETWLFEDGEWWFFQKI